MNTSQELSRTNAAIANSQARSAELDQTTQQSILGHGHDDIQAKAAEFILRVMLRNYEQALLIEAEEELKARKALATA